MSLRNVDTKKLQSDLEAHLGRVDELREKWPMLHATITTMLEEVEAAKKQDEILTRTYRPGTILIHDGGSTSRGAIRRRHLLLVTKHHFVVATGYPHSPEQKFRRLNGYELGDGYWRAHVDDDERKHIEHLIKNGVAVSQREIDAEKTAQEAAQKKKGK